MTDGTGETGDAIPQEIVSRVMSGYSAMRRRVNRHCVVCGKLLENVTTRRLYCGVACSVRATRERHGKASSQKVERTAAGS